MELSKLVILSIAFSIVLVLLTFLYIYRPAKKKALERQKKRIDTVEKRREEIPSFHKLVDLIKSKATTTEELDAAVKTLLKYYGKIKPKNGIAPSKDFKRYAEVIYAVARHPNTNKDIVLFFDRELNRLNPDYAREIDEMLNRGLSARGAMR